MSVSIEESDVASSSTSLHGEKSQLAQNLSFRQEISTCSQLAISSQAGTDAALVDCDNDDDRDSVNKSDDNDNGCAFVHISSAKRNEITGRRVYDKEHFCFFCGKPYTKMARHLIAVHGDEEEVGTIIALPLKSDQRKLQLESLLRHGDFLHNHEVLSMQEGTLVLMRRPSMQELAVSSYDDYGPCPDCLGFLHKKHLWQHVRLCPHKNTTTTTTNGRRQVQKESLALLGSCYSRGMSADFNMNVISGMMNDDILRIVKSDGLITSYGISEYEMLGDAQIDTIRQNIRGLGKLMQVMREKMNNVSCMLRDCLRPETFDQLIEGILTLVRSDLNEHGRRELGIPSLALKLGYSLKKCAGIMLGQSIKNRQDEDERTANAFLKLYELEWKKGCQSVHWPQ